MVWFHPTEDMQAGPIGNQLRPEVLESLFYMWRFTGEPMYQQWAWRIFQSVEKYSKVESGYAGLEVDCSGLAFVCCFIHLCSDFLTHPPTPPPTDPLMLALTHAATHSTSCVPLLTNATQPGLSLTHRSFCSPCCSLMFVLTHSSSSSSVPLANQLFSHLLAHSLRSLSPILFC